ncbi:MAG: TatD family hydrolase [Deltaproteobacteria bacterium]|nr:TatD family hydrolase [Deltaproteobacteria bacterium]
MIELIDTHIHLDAADFDADREEVITRARSAGVCAMITVGAGYGLESATRAVEIASSHGDIWASVGVHPHDAGKEFSPDAIRKLCSNKKVVAIGETGLDFYRDWSPKERQYSAFRTQIELALEVGKPLIIHCRQAAEECLSVLQEMRASEVGGVFHCFSEDAAFARKLMDINFIVSIPGSVTFKKADALRDAVRQIPLDRIMLETDAPFLAPEPHRGKRCESALMVETAKAVADIKKISFEELAAATTHTARAFFKLNG